MRKLKLKTQLLITQIEFFIMVFLLFFTYFFIFYYFISPIEFEKNSLKIDVSELNCSEKEIAYSLLKEVRHEYLTLARTINFTKNIEPGIWGQNYRSGDITLLFQDYADMKIVLCHELAHSFIFTNNEEWFADDLAEKEVCYG